MRSILFNLAGSLFAGLAVYAAFEKPESTWPLVALAVASVAAANLDRIKELSASGAGFKVILDRAEIAVDQLRKLVKQNAASQLALLQRGNRWDGWSDAEMEEARREAVEMMRENGVAESEIKSLLAKVWHPYVHIDYCQAISGGLNNHNMSKSEWAEWKRMTEGLDRPTADEIEAFLKKLIVVDGLRRELLDDYRHYRQHGESANPQAYRRRRELTKSPPNFVRELKPEDSARHQG